MTFEDYQNELDKRAEKLPKCSCCGDTIFSNYAAFIDDEWYCEECEQDRAKDLWNDYGRDQFLKGVEI